MTIKTKFFFKLAAVPNQITSGFAWGLFPLSIAADVDVEYSDVINQLIVVCSGGSSDCSGQ